MRRAGERRPEPERRKKSARSRVPFVFANAAESAPRRPDVLSLDQHGAPLSSDNRYPVECLTCRFPVAGLPSRRLLSVSALARRRAANVTAAAPRAAPSTRESPPADLTPPAFALVTLFHGRILLFRSRACSYDGNAKAFRLDFVNTPARRSIRRLKVGFFGALHIGEEAADPMRPMFFSTARGRRRRRREFSLR